MLYVSNRSKLGSPHIVHVARECAEIAAAGGVGDVVLQLALESARSGLKTTIILPHYGPHQRDTVRETAAKLAPALPWPRARVRVPEPLEFEIPMAYAEAPERVESARVETIVFEGRAQLTVALVVADRFTGKERPYTYTAAEAKAILLAPPGTETVCGAEIPPPEFPVEEGHGHFDYFAMNVLLQRAALAWMEQTCDGPLVIHCHDAHTAMLPMIARHADPPSPCADSGFVVTAHNCGKAYRQRCADLRFVAAVSGTPFAAIAQCVIETEFDPFGAAALYADHLTTVSDGYAWEVQRAWMPTSGGDEEIVGFSQFLAKNGVRIRGIPNGISADRKGPKALRGEIGRAALQTDDFGWKPEFRKRFVHRVSRATMPKKWGIGPNCRHGHLKRLAPDGPLFTFVGRWTDQKGVDIVLCAAREVLQLHPEAGLCIFGEGSQSFVLSDMLELADEFQGRVVVVKGFSDVLARSIYAAGDFFLVPSRFEPCGLIDMIAQLNGNIPIVNQVGGLAKVVDGVTGIGYFATNDRTNMRGLVQGMRRAIALHADEPSRTRVQRAASRAVRDNYNWKSVFRRYAPLYGISLPTTQRNSRQPALQS